LGDKLRRLRGSRTDLEGKDDHRAGVVLHDFGVMASREEKEKEQDRRGDDKAGSEEPVFLPNTFIRGRKVDAKEQADKLEEELKKRNEAKADEENKEDKKELR